MSEDIKNAITDLGQTFNEFKKAFLKSQTLKYTNLQNKNKK